MPRLEVPSRATERPVSSSTVKVRLEQKPKKRFDALRFVAFALACIALGFVMTTAIRILFVDAKPGDLAITPNQVSPPAATAIATTPTQAAQDGMPADRNPPAPPKNKPRGDDTVRIEPRPSQATTVVPAKRPTPNKEERQPGASRRARNASLTWLAEAAAASSAPLEAQTVSEPEPLATDSPKADYRRANRLIAAGNIEQAIEEMSVLLESNASDHRAMANIASANLKAGQTQEAIRWAKKAVRVRPEDAAYQNILGDALGLLGEREQALVHWNEAKRLKAASSATTPE